MHQLKKGMARERMTWRMPPYLGELSYFLAHFEMEILVILHAKLGGGG